MKAASVPQQFSLWLAENFLDDFPPGDSSSRDLTWSPNIVLVTFTAIERVTWTHHPKNVTFAELPTKYTYMQNGMVSQVVRHLSFHIRDIISETCSYIGLFTFLANSNRGWYGGVLIHKPPPKKMRHLSPAQKNHQATLEVLHRSTFQSIPELLGIASPVRNAWRSSWTKNNAKYKAFTHVLFRMQLSTTCPALEHGETTPWNFVLDFRFASRWFLGEQKFQKPYSWMVMNPVEVKIQLWKMQVQ